jgi:hypothetical protein
VAGEHEFGGRTEQPLRVGPGPGEHVRTVVRGGVLRPGAG